MVGESKDVDHAEAYRLASKGNVIQHAQPKVHEQDDGSIVRVLLGYLRQRQS